MNQILGYFLISLIAVVPGVTAYFHAKNFFKFPQKSILQFAAIIASLVLMFGVIPVQGEILDVLEIGAKNDYLRKLTLFQYLIAAVIFFWKLRDVEKKRNS